MILSYLPVHFYISFDSPANADTPPLFVLRSVLGKELRSMSCVSHQIKCVDCMYKNNCAYAFLFETILQSENDVLPGRNRASHPFAFTQASKTGKTIKDYDFTITLFGKAIDYLSCINEAFVHAGKNGLFKSRTPFSVTVDENLVDKELQLYTIEVSNGEGIKNGEILVELKSPLRFKTGGRYGTEFSAQDFMNCLFRRASTLCKLYGSCEEDFRYVPNENICISERNLHWAESTHYSARQKNKMELGGVIGTLKLKGTFLQKDIELLEFARIANAGKNTNFGLGQMDFWVKWE